MSPLETSPVSSYREQLRRRNSSVSSNYDRSPVTPLKHRFSNASQLSHDLPTPSEEGGGGLGNLADELEQLDDEDEEEDATNASMEGRQENDKEPRDSGVDVNYNSKQSVRNFSKPFGTVGRPPDEEEESAEDVLPPDVEDAVNAIARMAASTSTSEDPLIPRTVALLQDLGNQSALETATQRLTTSTNSLSTHLTSQGKSLQATSTSLFSPFAGYTFSLSLEDVEEMTPLIEDLLSGIPQPDPTSLQGIQKLERETANVIKTLSQLIDTLQMGRQITNSASRNLRATQTMVVDLRREHERAELARHELAKADVERQLKERRCAVECKDVMGGFEEVCDALRASLESESIGDA